MIRGEWGEGFTGTTIKDTRTKGGGWRPGMEVSLDGVVVRGGEKIQATVIDQI